jgi:hypothetical protein
LILKNQLTGSGALGISPNGHYFLYWKDNKFQAYDLDAATSRTLAGTSPASFVDMEYDHPGPKPSYGLAGYTSDGKNVIVQQRYDLWVLPLDGSAARSLTNGAGAKNEMRFRYVRTEPAEGAGGGPGGPGGGGGRGGGGAARQTIDLSKPITLSAYGEYTKKAGFYTLANSELKEVVYEDAAFSNPSRAAKADVFLYARQTFVEFPDLCVSGPASLTRRRSGREPPAEGICGRRVLFDFKNKDATARLWRSRRPSRVRSGRCW